MTGKKRTNNQPSECQNKSRMRHKNCLCNDIFFTFLKGRLHIEPDRLLMIKQRYKNCIKSAKTYLGADVSSNQILLMVHIRVRLKKNNKNKSDSGN